MVTTASACGKAILLGEHAVVYGRPALAVPISQIRAWAEIAPGPAGQGATLVAQDLGRVVRLADAPDDLTAPLQHIVRATLAALGWQGAEPDLEVRLHSQVPIARGLGSGAAIATAIVRALAAHLGAALSVERVSALVYESESLLHGHPSGVDNTVVAYEAPVCYARASGFRFVQPGGAFELVIGDSGVPARTRDTVASVRRGWEADRPPYEALFDTIAVEVQAGRDALERGDAPKLGAHLSANHGLLSRLGVSAPVLDALVAAAQRAGALGAKLTGGGGGGCMLALAAPGASLRIAQALRDAGACQVWTTVLAPPS